MYLILSSKYIISEKFFFGSHLEQVLERGQEGDLLEALKGFAVCSTVCIAAKQIADKYPPHICIHIFTIYIFNKHIYIYTLMFCISEYYIPLWIYMFHIFCHIFIS